MVSFNQIKKVVSCKHKWTEIALIRTGMLPFYLSDLIQCKKCKEVKIR